MPCHLPRSFPPAGISSDHASVDGASVFSRQAPRRGDAAQADPHAILRRVMPGLSLNKNASGVYFLEREGWKNRKEKETPVRTGGPAACAR
jgi:hypothetical protein